MISSSTYLYSCVYIYMYRLSFCNDETKTEGRYVTQRVPFVVRRRLTATRSFSLSLLSLYLDARNLSYIYIYARVHRPERHYRVISVLFRKASLSLSPMRKCILYREKKCGRRLILKNYSRARCCRSGGFLRSCVILYTT